MPDLPRNADADRVGEDDLVGAACTSRAAISRTRAGSIAPSNGQPNEVPIVTVARMPSSCARATIRSADCVESSTVVPWLRWLNSSLAANAKCTSSSPVSRRRS